MQQLLEEIISYIPSYPPLQCFNATNPLLGLNSLSFAQAIAEVSQFVPIYGTLELHDYHRYWHEGAINISDLEYAVRKFSQQHELNDDESGEIIQVLLDKKFQTQSELMDTQSRILASNRVPWADNINKKVIQFVSRFYDIGQAKWPMPVHSQQLFLAWREYVAVQSSARKLLTELPEDAPAAIEYLLSNSALSSAEYKTYLITVLFQIIGWASFVNWLEHAPHNPFVAKAGRVVDLLAIWLAEASLQGDIPRLATAPPSRLKQDLQQLFCNCLPPQNLSTNYLRWITRQNLGLIWQQAFEQHFHSDLARQINLNYTLPPSQVRAQALFCVDVRSEGLRRHLESYGNYATYGLAGFFGIGFDFHFHHHVTRQAPDWTKAQHNLSVKSRRLGPFHKIFKNLITGVTRSKKSFLAPLVLFDVVGLWYSFRIMANTLLPFKKHDLNRPSLNYASFDFIAESDYSTTELSTTLANLLTTIGLRSNFAPLVIVCGHHSEAVNNPYESALHCGACGGNNGAPNVIAFCQSLNNPAVRQLLAQEQQIIIPPTTWFIAATHNTTTDEVNYYNLHEVAAEQQGLLQQICADFAKAGDELRRERSLQFDNLRSVHARKSDWAELVPELAQINNAALVIGPRELTRNLNLHRRVFLQSYDYRNDTDGKIIADIFNSTVQVVYAINSQYYFSTTDHQLYGSGNKAVHNIVAQLGVMEGNSSDLKIGLTQQSLFLHGKLFHQPLRLVIMVQAREEHITQVLAQNVTLANLIQGGWFSLQVIAVG